MTILVLCNSSKKVQIAKSLGNVGTLSSSASLKPEIVLQNLDDTLLSDDSITNYDQVFVYATKHDLENSSTAVYKYIDGHLPSVLGRMVFISELPSETSDIESTLKNNFHLVESPKVVFIPLNSSFVNVLKTVASNTKMKNDINTSRSADFLRETNIEKKVKEKVRPGTAPDASSISSVPRK